MERISCKKEDVITIDIDQNEKALRFRLPFSAIVIALPFQSFFFESIAAIWTSIGQQYRGRNLGKNPTIYYTLAI